MAKARNNSGDHCMQKDMKDRYRKPTPIITATKDGKMEYFRENLRGILDPNTLKDTPIAVLSIAGTKRLGKSFLLNLLCRYLKEKGWEKENKEWISGWDSSIPGFAWRGGVDAVTNGIVAWGQPIIVQRPKDGKRIAVILLDTEGNFDTAAHKNTSVRIFALSTIFSSLQIFNVSKQITSNDLQHLEYFTKQAQVTAVCNPQSEVYNEQAGQGNIRPFEGLMFLVRDWPDPTSYGRGSGRKYLDTVLCQQSSGDGKTIASVDHHPLYGAFNEISCFLMAEPAGRHVRVRPSTSQTIITPQDLGDEFISTLHTFCQEYLHPSQILTKRQNVEYLFCFMEECIKRIMEGALPDLQDISDLMANMIKEKSESKAVIRFVDNVTEFIKETTEPSWAPFDDFVHKKIKAALAEFKSEVQPFLSKEDLKDKSKLMEQMLQEKAGYTLTRQMQAKVIPYAMHKYEELFVTRVETDIKEMKHPSWGEYDQLVRVVLEDVTVNFRNEAQHSGMTIAVEEKALELRKKLDECAARHLSKLMEDRVILFVTGNVEQYFKTNVSMGISTMTELSWETFKRLIHRERSQLMTKFQREVDHKYLTVDLTIKMTDLQNQLEKFVKDELTQQMQVRIVPYALDAAEKFFIERCTKEISETRDLGWTNFDEAIRNEMTMSIHKFLGDVRHPGTDIGIEVQEKLRTRLIRYTENDLTWQMEERIVSHYMTADIKHFTNNMRTMISEMSEPTWNTFDQLIKKNIDDTKEMFKQHVLHPTKTINIETHMQELCRKLDACVEYDLARRLQAAIIPHVENEVRNSCIKQITKGIEMNEPCWKKFDDMVSQNISDMIKMFRAKVQHRRLTIDVNAKQKKIRSELEEYVKDKLTPLMERQILPYAMDQTADCFLESVTSEINKMEELTWHRFDRMSGKMGGRMFKEFIIRVQHPQMTMDLDEKFKKCYKKLDQTCHERATSLMQTKIVTDMMIRLPKTFTKEIAESIDGMNNPMWEKFDDIVKEKTTEITIEFSNMIRIEMTNDILQEKARLEQSLRRIVAEDMSPKLRTKREEFAAQAIAECLENGKIKLEDHGGKAFPTWGLIKSIKIGIEKELNEKLSANERDSDEFCDMIEKFHLEIRKIQSNQDFSSFLKRFILPTGSFFSFTTVGVILAEISLGPAAIVAIGSTVGGSIVVNAAMSFWDWARG